MTVFAWLAGAALDEREVVGHLGPGLAASVDAAPIPALAWNAFAFACGRRLLSAMNNGETEQHVIDVCVAALVRIAAVAESLGEPDAELQAGVLEATLRPMTTLSPSPAAPFMMRLYAWGVRRIQRDRRLEDSLATLCAEARALHGQLAERFGRDADAAVAAELAAQLADARVVLAGAADSLVGSQDRG